MSHDRKDIHGIPKSAFSKTEWVNPKETPITKQEGLPALLLPNGQVLICPNPMLAGSVHKVFEQTLRAEIIYVKGTWTFVPDDEDLRLED